MKTLLIVEDEDIERVYLETLCRKLAGENVRVLSACNGAQALQICRKEQPDIILTDIYMPVMNGLELVEQIKKENIRSLCYILTSYDYFSYAQKAIQLGVEDFALKPINRTGLTRLLENALSILEKREKQDERDQRMHALEKKIEKDCFMAAVFSCDARQLSENLQLLGFDGSEECLAFMGHFSSADRYRNLLSEQKICCIGGEVDGQQMLILVSDGRFSAAQYDQIEKILDEQPDLFVSGTAIGSQELIGACRSLRRRHEHTSTEQTWQVEQDLIFDLAGALFTGAETGKIDEQELSSLAQPILDTLSLDDLYGSLSMQIEELISRRYGEERHLSVKLDGRTPFGRGAQTLYEDLKHLLIQCQQSYSSRLYRRAVNYLESNYQRQISLSDVADELQVSIYSLSRLLNQNSISFSDLLHQVRIDEAKRLIRRGESFKSVSWRVGYSSQSYFSKNFKRIAGISPSAYKEISDLYHQN